jgi:long-chain fatty acid transport protein
MVTWSTGFRLPDQDAVATARGEAFAATADNPSAIYYNPGGVGYLDGHQVRLGLYGLNLQVEYEGQFENDRDLHGIPQFFYTYGPEKLPLAFGLGVYSPYGLSAEWPEDTGFRTVGTEGSLRYWTFNPVVAWRVVPSLSIAAGLTVNYASTELEQGLSPIPGNDYFRFEGDGTDLGFNAGVLWQPHPKLSFGAAYRSATEVEFEGTADTVVINPVPPFLPAMNVQLDARAAFQFPQNVVLGVSYRPTPDWNFEFNADWTDWNQLNSLVVVQEGGPTAETLFNWESSWYYEVGATRRLGEHWRVSAGYIFNENSVPDATYTPLVADLDRHFVSLGGGYTGERWSVDLAYQFGYGPEREVVGSALSPAGQSADGTYKFLSHALFLSLGVRF